MISAVLCVVAAFVYLPDHVRRAHRRRPAVASTEHAATRASSPRSRWSSASCWPASSCRSPATSPAPSTSRSRTSAETSLTGAATVILSGLSVGFESAVYTALVIAAAVFGAFLLAAGSITVALFAVALAGCGLLTTVGVIVAMDTFGPVSDNAQGIAEMSRRRRAREGAQILTELDAVGNTTKAITKGIAIATAVLAATALFGSYADVGARRARRVGDVGVASRARVAQLQRVQPEHAGRRAARRGGGVPVLRPGDQRRRPGRRRGRLRGAPPVPRDPRDHGGHRPAGVRQGRRHRHQGLAARAGHAGPAGGARADRGRLRPRRRPAGRLTSPARSAPAP